MARAWINPNGNGYTVFWLDEAKNQRQKTFRKKIDAQSFRTKIERELDTGSYIEPARGKELLVTLFERWSTIRGLEGSSIRQYQTILRQAIAPYFTTRTIGTVKKSDIQAWVLWLRDNKRYSAQTIQNRFGYLSSALQWAVDNDELGRNPAKGVKLPGRRANTRRSAKKKIVVPTLSEVSALIQATNPRYAALIWLMAGCGLRVGEAMGVCRQQIDFRNGVLHVDRQITEDGETDSGKNAGLRLKRYTKHRDTESPGREVPLPTVVAKVLRTHLATYGTWGTDKMLFPNASRTGLLYQSYLRNQIWLPAVKAASVPFTRTHVLRHFFASSMLSNGVPISDVAAWLGHHSVEVTFEYYGHLMPNASERGRAAVDIAMNGLSDLDTAAASDAVRDDEDGGTATRAV